MNTPLDDDSPLVHQALLGDYAAFEAIVAKYARPLFSLAYRIVGRRHDAEEVVQQTFLSLIEHLKDFREQSRFVTWLMHICTNHALLLLRKRAVRKAIPLAEGPSEEGYHDLPHPEFIAAWRETTDKIVAQHETHRLLDEALQALDEKYRVVFLLRDAEGLSTAETAAALGLSESNVKVRLLRARLWLREHLTRHFGDEAQRIEPHHHQHA